MLRFLLELSERIKPLAEAEAQVLLGRKRVLEAPYVERPCVDVAAKRRIEGVQGTATTPGGAGEDEQALYRPSMDVLEPWDYTFYTSQLRGAIRDSVRPAGGSGGTQDATQSLSRYLTLGNVMRGLSMITEKTLGVRLERQDLKPNEDWSGAGGHELKRRSAGDEAQGSPLAADGADPADPV